MFSPEGVLTVVFVRRDTGTNDSDSPTPEIFAECSIVSSRSGQRKTAYVWLHKVILDGVHKT